MHSSRDNIYWREKGKNGQEMDRRTIVQLQKVLLNLLNSLDRILLFDALKSMELIRSYFQVREVVITSCSFDCSLDFIP